MRHSLVAFVFLFLFSLLSMAQNNSPYIVTGGEGVPYSESPSSHMYVYFLNGMQNAQVSYTGSGTHQWYKYADRAADAIPIPCNQVGNTSTITDVENGAGYFVGSYLSPTTDYIWIIDYSPLFPKIWNISTEEDESDRCQFLKIVFDIEAEALRYYTPTGQLSSINREFIMEYDNLVWNEEAKMFDQVKKTIEYSRVLSEEIIDAPLSDTKFVLKGDQIARHFGKEDQAESAVYKSIAVKADASYETDKIKADNEMFQPGSDLGGSAPITYTFTAYANEPVERYTWQVSMRDSLTGVFNLKVSYTERVLRYTFEEWGMYKVQLFVDGPGYTCVDSTYFKTLQIGETNIFLPNAFSPGSSIGVNDVYKIGFTSLLSFRASIYNRWGNLLYEWSDPAEGWDGRVNGKFVPTGVYFIIVEYTDTSGRKRTKSRDINVLRTKNTGEE